MITKTQAVDILDIASRRIKQIHIDEAIKVWDMQEGNIHYYPIFLQVFCDLKWNEMVRDN